MPWDPHERTETGTRTVRRARDRYHATFNVTTQAVILRSGLCDEESHLWKTEILRSAQNDNGLGNNLSTLFAGGAKSRDSVACKEFGNVKFSRRGAPLPLGPEDLGV